MFALSLAFTLGYTLFDYGLPAPYNTIKDAAELAFGDEKQRERAFYGTAGLSEIMPPAGRIPFSVFKSLLFNDYNDLVKYQMWTWFPGGRLARDVYRSINDPSAVVDNLTGVPIRRTAWYLKKTREQDTIPTP